MEQAARRTPEPLAFSITFGANGGCGLVRNGEANFEFLCSQPWELGEYLRQVIGQHTGQSMTPPQYMAQWPPARPTSVPPHPRQHERSVESEPFEAPSFMQEASLVDRVASAMASSNGRAAAAALLGLGILQLLPSFWPFGA